MANVINELEVSTLEAIEELKTATNKDEVLVAKTKLNTFSEAYDKLCRLEQFENESDHKRSTEIIEIGHKEKQSKTNKWLKILEIVGGIIGATVPAVLGLTLGNKIVNGEKDGEMYNSKAPQLTNSLIKKR